MLHFVEISICSIFVCKIHLNSNDFNVWLLRFSRLTWKIHVHYRIKICYELTWANKRLNRNNFNFRFSKSKCQLFPEVQIISEEGWVTIMTYQRFMTIYLYWRIIHWSEIDLHHFSEPFKKFHLRICVVITGRGILIVNSSIRISKKHIIYQSIRCKSIV